MRRLTPTDWEVINAALAYYEMMAEDGDTEHTEAQVVRCREKIHERRREL